MADTLESLKEKFTELVRKQRALAKSSEAFLEALKTAELSAQERKDLTWDFDHILSALTESMPDDIKSMKERFKWFAELREDERRAREETADGT